jgi:hypothetical protein
MSRIETINLSVTVSVPEISTVEEIALLLGDIISRAIKESGKLDLRIAAIKSDC